MDVSKINVPGYDGLIVKDTTARNNSASALSVSETNWLFGKKVVVYGDSTGTAENNFIGKLVGHGAEITNRCIGGTTLSVLDSGINPDYENNSGYQRIMAADDLNSFDYIFIVYGINDWQVSQKILSETQEDTHSVDYALRAILGNVISTYPSCIPVVFTPFFCYKKFSTSEPINNRGCSLSAYARDMVRVCSEFGVLCIDFYTESPVNASNYQTYLRNDSGVYVHALSNLSDILVSITLGRNTAHGWWWSTNEADSYQATREITQGDYDNVIVGVPNYPKYPIANTRSVVEMKPVFSGTKTKCRVSGYVPDSGQTVVGFTVLYDGEQAALVNISKFPTYFEMEFDVYCKSKLTLAPVTDKNTAIIRGYRIEFEGKDSDSVSVDYGISSGNENIQIVGTPKIKVINGLLISDPVEATVTGDISSGKILSLIGIRKRCVFNYTIQRSGGFISASGYTLRDQIGTYTPLKNGDRIFIDEIATRVTNVYLQ